MGGPKELKEKQTADPARVKGLKVKNWGGHNKKGGEVINPMVKPRGTGGGGGPPGHGYAAQPETAGGKRAGRQERG